ncbi:MAG: tetratricopeptide repeat protein [Pseudomonadota bacterium]
MAGPPDRSLPKILLVNDKLDLRNIIRDYLREEGYGNISVSENGLSALKKAAADPPDLIIADFDLPGLTGLDLLAKIRQDRLLAETPFILISPETEQKYVAKAAEHRVSAYVVKPFSHKTLLGKVDPLLERRMNPSAGDILFLEANRLAQAGNLEAALEKYLAAMDVTKKSMASLHFKIGQAHEMMSQEGQAEADYHEAIGLSDVFVDAYDALGAIQLRNQRPEDALRFFFRSSEISPLNADRQLALGEALLQTGHFSEAERAFKMVLDLDPNAVNVFNRLGISLRRQKKTEEALQYFLKALEKTGEDENLLYNISRVYFDKGDLALAKNYLKKALKLKPDFQEACDLLLQIG